MVCHPDVYFLNFLGNIEDAAFRVSLFWPGDKNPFWTPTRLQFGSRSVAAISALKDMASSLASLPRWTNGQNRVRVESHRQSLHPKSALQE